MLPGLKREKILEAQRNLLYHIREFCTSQHFTRNVAV